MQLIPEEILQLQRLRDSQTVFWREAQQARIEALLVPPVANPKEPNLAVFLDNQYPKWRIELSALVLVDDERWSTANGPD